MTGHDRKKQTNREEERRRLASNGKSITASASKIVSTVNMVVILNHPPLQSPRMENLYTYLGKYLFNFEFKRLSE